MAFKRNIEKLIVGQDIYGHAVSVHYRGSDYFRTRIGAIFTMVTYVLIAINTIQLIIAFSNGSKQQASSQVYLKDRYYEEAQYLKENDFEIVLLLQEIIPSEIGSIKAK